MNGRKITVGLLAVCVLVASASGPRLFAENPKARPDVSTPAAVVAKDEKTTLSSGDRINYRVIEDRDDTKVLVVSPSGELEVPYLGRVALGGKTLDEAAKIVKGLLEKDLYFQATVTMSHNTSVPAGQMRQVSVVGQVRTQGPQDMPNGEKYMLSRAIVKAGMGQFGNGKAVQVIRKKADGSTDRIEVNVDAILKDGETGGDIELMPDDLIIVKQKFINF